MGALSLVALVVAGLLGLGLLVAIWFIIAYNGLVNLRNQVKNAWSQIEVQLKRRYEFIPNLVETVKDYMSYEQETLQNVTKARQVAVAARTPGEIARAEGALTQALMGLYAVMENYPQLKADTNVARLQEELTSTENKVAFSRQFYNDSVMRYNIRIETIPTNLVAGMFGFGKQEFFEVEAPEERKVPKVDLR